ncbi:galactokinase [Virgibacillus salexigens]|uniref:Galactokinase n=1 Tax=Virgibacillus kapii TaxID=1638645 RepID=A0ABQ2DEJ7_9BACI|nr:MULTISPECIES: galactokinase [Virgibacillus]MYL40777.1 galactokinase [Virgibacillus massiliensis]GGJ51710.1 galactokinase [Virgibacillus kapii]
MKSSELQTMFQNIFHTTKKPRLFFAPGRINLIGEHTDYNGGNVFPAAITFGTYAACSKREDKRIRFYSSNFSETGIIECELSNLNYQASHNWANYPKGMIQFLINEGHLIDQGMDILFYGDIPNSAGLSSSASIEMVTGVLLEGIFSLNSNRIEMIKLGQRVENEYIGVSSGIMDQFAIGMGKKNHAILLDCQSLNFYYAPLELKDHVILIINTNKQRTLAGSKYNERRTECEQALFDLRKQLPIASLGELTPDEFETNAKWINNPIHQKRAKHAVYENARTKEALEKLRVSDLDRFGELMNESHLSLKYDYEVTGIELDTIVEAAWDQPGVLGARMTGAGFGGCAIAVVERKYTEAFRKNVNTIYEEKIGYPATFYSAEIGDGAKEIIEEVV